MANIRDIAKRANVGIATVSRYMNQRGYVSEESARKIKAVVDELDYTPNALARAVFQKSSRAIGLMLPNIANPFFTQIVTNIEKVTWERGYTIILCNTEDNKQKEKEYLDLLKSHRVSGIVALRPLCKEEYIKTNIPLTTFENKIHEDIVDVSSDNLIGGRRAFMHLYECGCRRILHVTGPKDFKAVYERYEGFVSGAKEKDVYYKVVDLISDFQVDMIENDINDMDHLIDFDGIFAFNDITAALVLQKLRSKGIKVPEDVQIVSYDNSMISQMTDPPLSTIDQNIKEISRQLIENLFLMMEGKEVPNKNVIVPGKLIVRQSTILKKEDV